MFVKRVVQVLRRQLVVTLVGLLATGVAAFAVFRSTPPSYSLTATVLLLPPSLPDAKTGQSANPYLQLGGLSGPAEVLARAVNDPAVQQEAVGLGLSRDFEVARDFLTSAPVVLVTVQDTDLTRARATRDWLLDRLPKTLLQLQASVKVPPAAMMTSTVISPEGEVTRSSKSTLRLLLVVVAAGLMATLVLATVIDTLRRERSRRRATRPQGSVPHPEAGSHGSDSGPASGAPALLVSQRPIEVIRHPDEAVVATQEESLADAPPRLA